MKKALLQKIKKDKLVVKELRRAHIMIVLLALAVAALVLLYSITSAFADPALLAVLFVLTIVIALISIGFIVIISKK